MACCRCRSNNYNDDDDDDYYDDGYMETTTHSTENELPLPVWLAVCRMGPPSVPSLWESCVTNLVRQAVAAVACVWKVCSSIYCCTSSRYHYCHYTLHCSFGQGSGISTQLRAHTMCLQPVAAAAQSSNKGSNRERKRETGKTHNRRVHNLHWWWWLWWWWW